MNSKKSRSTKSAGCITDSVSPSHGGKSVLVIAHAHPDFSKGGGETAAYNCFLHYPKLKQVSKAWFLARVEPVHGSIGKIYKRRENEFVWEQSVLDWHTLVCKDRNSVLTSFRNLLETLRPDVIHAHHFAHIGLEFIRIARQVLPDVVIVFTLHEFISMCENDGQMIKTDGSLCYESTPEDCQRCFPNRLATDFWARRHYVQSYFSEVDHFVSPSAFLRDRFVSWGIDADRIQVIENGQDDWSKLPPRPLERGETRSRFGYFGQINKYKGILQVLEALASMTTPELKTVTLEIHGANLDKQSEDLQQRIRALCEPLIKSGAVKWIGPYSKSEIQRRMGQIDWVLVPSIWWENSPMVIQEAFLCGRPVICSGIGGMAEKVQHGVNGYHVPVGSVFAWKTMLLEMAQLDDEWDRLHMQIKTPPKHEEILKRHTALFFRNPS